MDGVADFGDYLVFVDESGDHNLTRIDPQFPVFVLLFAIIKKTDYVDQVCPGLQRFKLKYWGHDEVVLHEHEIRKPRDEFGFLHRKEVRESFLSDLSAEMDALPAEVIAVVIDKQKFVKVHADPANPYDYALEEGLEGIFQFLQRRNQREVETPIVVETRGRKEDAELELAFRRVCDGHNSFKKTLPFKLVMVAKISNSSGLQITDLMARPIALKHIRPNQKNRAYDMIEPKLVHAPDSEEFEGWGIRRYP